ncbi:MAG: UDP-N-acetylmuramoyl-tripeptide--D-alanyl-D-alanine ligase [Patescibacteria group bacterium]
MKALFRSIVVFLVTLEARIVLRKYKPRVIAVTGSVGKTTTKDAVFTALSSSQFVQKSEKTLNTDIGVPLAILGATNAWESIPGWLSVLWEGLKLIVFRNHFARVLVLEVGADHPGDIARIMRYLVPDCAVVTGVPDVPPHIAFYDSVEAVVREKESLVAALKSKGTLVLNGDDQRVRSMKNRAGGRTLTYGFTEGVMVRATDYEVVWENNVPAGVRFCVSYKGSSFAIMLPGCLGRAHVYAVLGGVAVALSEGIEPRVIEAVYARHVAPPGRMRIVRGLHGSTIIDDSYNSSPAAVLVALETLAELRKHGGRILVALGDMRELGEHSKDAHARVGRKVAPLADQLITVGEESGALAESALAAGMPLEHIRRYGYGESGKAGKELAPLLKKGDIVLVKGSQNKIRMERFVKEVMADPTEAKKVLVRQEREWIAIV